MRDWAGIALMAAGIWMEAVPLFAASNVAPPNILWHDRVTGQGKLWIMNGTNFVSEIALPTTSDDPAWKMVGTGDFNQDGQPDIAWQNETTGQPAVWFMKGPILHSAALIKRIPDLTWKLVGVADFNGDRKPDLLWQNLTLGQNAVWLMNGTTLLSANFITSNGDPFWKIVATGDINHDGKSDIILRNQSTGQNATWFMNGLNFISGDLLRTVNGNEAIERDQDWQIVGTGDYNGDGKLDLLWRHATVGMNVCWYMNSSIVARAGHLGKHEFETNWRIAGQETAESTWRLRTAEFSYVRPSVSISPPRVDLSFKIVRSATFGVTIQRRLSTETQWTTLVTRAPGETYTDSAVSLGNAYEYRIFREGFGGIRYSAPEHVTVGLNARPIENRGKLILLVDETLASQITVGVQQLTQDLVGDGWTVIRHNVPRHIDDYTSPTSFRTNGFNITNVIKPLIRAVYDGDPTNTKAVFILGHVSIPYSGTYNPDGHTCAPPPLGPDHRGAWPADMFYGDMDGTWTDRGATLTNCDFVEPHNVPNDGKFDQDGIPAPFSLKLAVGRVDFARLPVFTSTPPPGVAAKSEAALLLQYLTKDHRYRHKLNSWQQGNTPLRGMVYGNFHDGRDNQIFENAKQTSLAISANPDSLTVGDFYLQNARPSAWGFLAGAGLWDRVNQAIPVLEHTSAHLANPANEPKTSFYILLSSFMGDWNLRTDNFLRSLLATPNHGLASMWTRAALWRTDALGIGEHLGAALTRMVSSPKNTFYDQSRDLTILGDPTLRLHVLAPPTNLKAASSALNVLLSWNASESGAQYYVYRGQALNGPFTRIASAPVSGLAFTDNSPPTQQKVYMVRAIKPLAVGNGAYTNLSQGAFASLP